MINHMTGQEYLKQALREEVHAKLVYSPDLSEYDARMLVLELVKTYGYEILRDPPVS